MGVIFMNQDSIPSTDELWIQLVLFVRKKFYSRQQIFDLAEDIVNQAFLDVIKIEDSKKLNFGYLSKACIHIAFRLFKRNILEISVTEDYDDCLLFLNSESIVDEIIEKENSKEILDSLDVLKSIERIIIMQRYYGNYSFNQIAESNGLKLNTVLSHHRRALEKLRPLLSEFSCGRNRNTIRAISASEINENSHFSKNF